MGLTLAIAAAVLGPAFAVAPSTISASSIVDVLPIWAAQIWLVMYAAAGIAVTVGILRAKPNLEAAGFVLFGGALITYAFTIAASRGFSSGVAFSVLGSLGLGMLIRAFVLVRRFPREG